MRASQATTRPQTALQAALPMLPGQQPNGATEESEVEEIARECYAASFGGAHKLSAEQSYDVAAAFLVERERRRDDR